MSKFKLVMVLVLASAAFHAMTSLTPRVQAEEQTVYILHQGRTYQVGDKVYLQQNASNFPGVVLRIVGNDYYEVWSMGTHIYMPGRYLAPRYDGR